MSETNHSAQFYYLLHPCHTFLVTCQDTNGNANIITIAWLIPVSVTPPLIAMSIRPTRYSYELIDSTLEFAINVPSHGIAQEVLFCGRNSGRDVDKFDATGLTPGDAQMIRVPIIKECMAHLECKVMQEIEVGDHQLIIAEVLMAYTRADVLGDTGQYDLMKMNPLLHLGRNFFTGTSINVFEPLPKSK